MKKFKLVLLGIVILGAVMGIYHPKVFSDIDFSYQFLLQTMNAGELSFIILVALFLAKK